MSLGLDALFEERLEAFPADTSSISHSPLSVDAIIQTLIKERDDACAQVKEHASTIEQLERRIYTKVAANDHLSADAVNRLHRLESGCVELRKKNKMLHENLNAAENETATLRNTTAEESKKAKGALKKTKNAKEVASKVEEKAKNAVNDKQLLLKTHQIMKKERNDALASVGTLEKIMEDLRAELQLQQSGIPHLRDTEGSQSSFTTLVIPIELRIARANHMRTLSRLRFRQKYFMNQVQSWHEAWTTRLELDDIKNEAYADDSEGEELDNSDKEDKLYGGIVEGGDLMTGAEQDD